MMMTIEVEEVQLKMLLQGDDTLYESSRTVNHIIIIID
jgi:hypothetical protein